MALRVYHDDHPTCWTRDQAKANDLHIFDQQNLEHLANVDISSPANLHIPYYDLAAAKWKSRLLSSWGLSSLGTKVLNDLDNVNVPTPTDQYVLKYDSGSGLWIASLVPAHKDRHDPEDGADPLDAAAAGTIQPGDSAAEGSAHSFARSDHKHAIVAAAPSDIGVANAEGSGTSFSRDDHVHDIAGQAGQSPVVLHAWAHDSIGQGSWAHAAEATWVYGTYFNTTNADGDNILFKAYLAKGTYTIAIHYTTDVNRGIVDIDIDGGEVASFDLYGAAYAANQKQVDTGNVIATSGLKTITIRVDGKNGSSTGYYAIIAAVLLWRTA